MALTTARSARGAAPRARAGANCRRARRDRWSGVRARIGEARPVHETGLIRKSAAFAAPGAPLLKASVETLIRLAESSRWRNSTTLTGVAAPLQIDNVDTDMIIPKQFLKTIKRTGLGNGLFHEMRYNDDGSPNPDFVLNKPAYAKAKILVAGDNFGCGSSREHAPWALLDFGIRCIISTDSPISSTTIASRTAFCRSRCRRTTSTS